jgi:hypothetical protein
MAGKTQTKTEEDELDSLLTTKGRVGFKTDGKSQAKANMAGKRGTPSVKARMDFLQAVVCGRGTESQRFKDWFPDFSKGGLRSGVQWLRDEMELPCWQNQSVPLIIPSEDSRQAYEEILRYMLRVVWHRAIAEDNPQVAAVRIRLETRGLQHFTRNARGEGGSKPGLTEWVIKTERALEWLERNTHKLRRCGIADCKHPYFIVTPSRKTYCSDYCKEVAEVERSKRRVAVVQAKKAEAVAHGAKPSRLTPQGTTTISEAAKAKAQRIRTKKRIGKGR